MDTGLITAKEHDPLRLVVLSQYFNVPIDALRNCTIAQTQQQKQDRKELQVTRNQCEQNHKQVEQKTMAIAHLKKQLKKLCELNRALKKESLVQGIHSTPKHVTQPTALFGPGTGIGAAAYDSNEETEEDRAGAMALEMHEVAEKKKAEANEVAEALAKKRKATMDASLLACSVAPLRAAPTAAKATGADPTNTVTSPPAAAQSQARADDPQNASDGLKHQPGTCDGLEPQPNDRSPAVATQSGTSVLGTDPGSTRQHLPPLGAPAVGAPKAAAPAPTVGAPPHTAPGSSLDDAGTIATGGGGQAATKKPMSPPADNAGAAANRATSKPSPNVGSAPWRAAASRSASMADASANDASPAPNPTATAAGSKQGEAHPQPPHPAPASHDIHAPDAESEAHDVEHWVEKSLLVIQELERQAEAAAHRKDYEEADKLATEAADLHGFIRKDLDDRSTAAATNKQYSLALDLSRIAAERLPAGMPTTAQPEAETLAQNTAGGNKPTRQGKKDKAEASLRGKYSQNGKHGFQPAPAGTKRKRAQTVPASAGLEK